MPIRTRLSTLRPLLAGALVLLLVACGSVPPAPESTTGAPPRAAYSETGQEVTLFALGLIDTGYRFGGKNPEAGLDCSGMVAYIYNRAAGLALSGSAADIARKGRPIDRRQLRPGDLVFFNTRNAPFSHVGLYIGDERFIHAPLTNGRVRIDHLNARYYAQRFEAARSYFD
ncbi:MAG: C40 family peptidase [Propionivibrio sp.]